MKFTPGPWKAIATAFDLETAQNAIVGSFDVILPAQSMSVPEMVENANLIAAAPDMYEALKALTDLMIDISRSGAINLSEVGYAVIDAASKTLRKAEGC